MGQDNSSLKKTIWLTLARIFGIFFSFAIPMYLGRALEVEEYGTYKQVMLFYWFAQVALNLGLDDSAYYYLRWSPKQFPLYSFNALTFNVVITTLIGFAFSLLRMPIAQALGNPALASYIPMLSLLIVLTVSSMQLEGILIGLERLKQRLYLELGIELLKALAILGAYYFYNSLHMVLMLLSLLMGVRLLLTIVVIEGHRKELGLLYRDSWPLWREQLKFGLPLGLSRIMQNILNLEKFLISSLHTVRDFTFYTVGCFENPLVNATQASFYEMANIEMVDAVRAGRKDLALEIWRNMLRKLHLIATPFIVYMIFFAKELMGFIFSAKYLESAPYFVLFNFFIFAQVFNPEPLFRATFKTNLYLKLRTIGFLLGAVALVCAAVYLPPISVLFVKVVLFFLLNGLTLVVGGRLLGASPLKLARWRELGLLILVCILWAYPCHLMSVKYLHSLHYFWILAISFSLYGFLCLLSALLTGLISKDERELIFKKINRR